MEKLRDMLTSTYLVNTLTGPDLVFLSLISVFCNLKYPLEMSLTQVSMIKKIRRTVYMLNSHTQNNIDVLWFV